MGIVNGTIKQDRSDRSIKNVKKNYKPEDYPKKYNDYEADIAVQRDATFETHSVYYMLMSAGLLTGEHGDDFYISSVFVPEMDIDVLCFSYRGAEYYIIHEEKHICICLRSFLVNDVKKNSCVQKVHMNGTKYKCIRMSKNVSVKELSVKLMSGISVFTDEYDV